MSKQMNSPRNNGASCWRGWGGRSSVTAGDGYLFVAEISTRADNDAALRMRRLCLILGPIPLSPPAC